VIRKTTALNVSIFFISNKGVCSNTRFAEETGISLTDLTATCSATDPPTNAQCCDDQGLNCSDPITSTGDTGDTSDTSDTSDTVMDTPTGD
jgi:hypothetical protein